MPNNITPMPEQNARMIFHAHTASKNPQDVTERPLPCRTPEPDLTRLEESLKSQHMAQDYSSSSVGDDYGCLPTFLRRRHSSNYLSALNSRKSPSSSVSPKPEEQLVDEVSPLDTQATIPPQILERQSSHDSQSSPHPHEDVKHLMQRGSIDLENARSTDQFNVQYHGTRRDSFELKTEEANEKFQKKHPAHLKKYHTHTSTCENGHDHPDCKPGFCFHSNQMLSRDQLQKFHQAPTYPETFEYNDFKRRMSFHD